MSSNQRCRLLPYLLADGPRNMAADEVLLETAAAGTASLRFYGWRLPTVSLGYFQPETLRASDPRLASLPYVRRPTGGEALVHHYELTYALALPLDVIPWADAMHAVIAAALHSFSITATTASEDRPAPLPALLCFLHVTAGDLLIGPSKIAGSARRKRRDAVLQHGGILLAASPFTPQLPGIQELTGQTLNPASLSQAIVVELHRRGAEVEPAAWTDAETCRIEELASVRYSRTAWNAKR